MATYCSYYTEIWTVGINSRDSQQEISNCYDEIHEEALVKVTHIWNSQYIQSMF